MERNEIAALIRGGEAVFGLELGSTRIKGGAHRAARRGAGFRQL